MIEVRIGVPSSFGRFGAVASSLGAPILVSANAFYRNGKFHKPKPGLFSARAALDSAGFVAMARYGDYRWIVRDYIELAASHDWDWWAAMDFCCEPQIAKNRDEVRHRYEMTVSYLGLCRSFARRAGIKSPMPVLQGWNARDYLSCADLMGELPEFVGVGSVCRRNVHGQDGLLSIVDALDRHLPPHVRLHLFGVKGDGVAALRGLDRIASIDSMAWDFACRREHKREGWENFCVAARSTWMRRWYTEQVNRLSEVGWTMQRQLFA